MSILPVNETKELHQFDEALDLVYNKDNITNSPILPMTADADLLPYLAKQYDLDVSLYDEEQSRELIAKGLWIKSKIGTIGAVKKALYGFDPDANIIEYKDVPTYNAQHKRDGTITRRAYGFTHWAQYIVELSRPISITQAGNLIALLHKVAPARCQLLNFNYEQTLTHDGAIRRDGTYIYGGN